MSKKEPRVVALDMPPTAELSAEMKAYFDKCQEKLGMIPNVLQAYAFDEAKLQAFSMFYNGLMLGDSGLNHCYYFIALSPTAQRCASFPAIRRWASRSP